ncbi:MAG: hypothetical protein ACRDNS_25810, partial [Trebonia sp.]
KAKAHGSEYRKHFRGTIKGIKGTANGGGYWIVTSKAHYSFGDARRYRYHPGRLRKYTGKQRPRGLRGRVVGYAVANIRTSRRQGGGGTTTTPTTTTTTPPTGTTTTPAMTTTTTPTGPTTTPTGTTTTPTVDCSSIAIQTGSLNSPTASDVYSQTLAAGGMSGGSWSWTIKSGSLPSGLSLSSAGVIAGTPAQSTAGTQSSFTMQATNSQCPGSPATKPFTLMVMSPMSITTSSLPDGVYGQAYDATLSATGGQPSDYVWSAPLGLPPGLTLSSSGVLSGTATGTGTFNGIEIELSDSTAATDPVYAYSTIVVSDPPLQITSPSSLSDGQATIAYGSVQFTGTGGTPGDTS